MCVRKMVTFDLPFREIVDRGLLDLQITEDEMQFSVAVKNDILSDMKIPYFYPHKNQTLEDTIVSCAKNGIHDPGFLYEIESNVITNVYTTKKYTVQTKKYNNNKYAHDESISTMLALIMNEKQTEYDEKILVLSSLLQDFYMLGNKLHMLDELNEKYCNKSGLIIDWVVTRMSVLRMYIVLEISRYMY